MKDFLAEDGFNMLLSCIAMIGLIIQIIFDPNSIKSIWIITVIVWLRVNHLEFLINQKMKDKSQL